MSTKPSTRGRTRHIGAVAMGVLLIAALTVLWSLRRERPWVPSEVVDSAPAPPVIAPPAVDGERVAVPPAEPAEGTGELAGARRSFEAIYRDLIELFGRPPEGDPSEATAAIAGLVTEMLVAYPDAGERTLMRVAALPTPWQAAGQAAGQAGDVEVRVATVLLDFALQRLATADGLTAGPGSLVDGLLASMPTGADMAGFVAKVLADRPYLEARHEGALIDLARQANGPLGFLAEPVRTLLLTVWANMQRTTGARELADLLAWFADREAGLLREAAMQRLLESERYRDLVVEQLIADKDFAGMGEATLYAAKRLPFRAAIGVLGTMQSANRHAPLLGAYAWLSATNFDDMQNHYEECLADNLMPRHRESLIVAIGNANSSPAAIAASRTAFTMDPDPGVRGAAFLALCNRAPTQEVAECLGVAMQDRNFAANYDLAFVVAGVRALARREDRDVNLIDLVTKFMLSQAGLQPWDREALEGVRREYLPR